MESDFAQLKNLLGQNQRALIAASPNAHADAVASGLALSYFLTKIGKESNFVIDKFQPHSALGFLPGISAIKNTLGNSKKMVFSVDLSKTGMDDLTYEVSDNKLHIFLTPKGGWWEKHEVSTSSAAFNHDLIITLNVKTVEHLGEPFRKNPDLFYRVPIINIDNNINNQRFGQVNLVDITASSLSELIYKILADYNFTLDETLSTQLLAGIITATNCFKSMKISPQILQIAGRLIDAGAKREEIIANLYRKHTIKSLQLWGRVLSRLKLDSQFGMAWATLGKNDFLETGADETYLNEVMDELILNAPEAKIAILIYEQLRGGVCCVIKTQKNINASKLIRSREGVSGEHTHEFCLRDKNPLDAEREVIEEIKNNLGDFVK